jgi:hypothetical protein
VAEKTKIVAEAPREPDLIPMENVSDEEFKKIVDEELHG